MPTILRLRMRRYGNQELIRRLTHIKFQGQLLTRISADEKRCLLNGYGYLKRILQENFKKCSFTYGNNILDTSLNRSSIIHWDVVIFREFIFGRFRMFNLIWIIYKKVMLFLVIGPSLISYEA